MTISRSPTLSRPKLGLHWLQTGTTRHSQWDGPRQDQVQHTEDELELNKIHVNPPTASQMEGVWERQIRTVSSVLSALLEKNGCQLNHKALTTFMCEAEAVMDSCPLTTPHRLSLLRLTNHPSTPQHAGQYSRKQWRDVQHLTNEFWTRWRK